MVKLIDELKNIRVNEVRRYFNSVLGPLSLNIRYISDNGVEGRFYTLNIEKYGTYQYFIDDYDFDDEDIKGDNLELLQYDVTLINIERPYKLIRDELHDIKEGELREYSDTIYGTAYLYYPEQVVTSHIFRDINKFYRIDDSESDEHKIDLYVADPSTSKPVKTYYALNTPHKMIYPEDEFITTTGQLINTKSFKLEDTKIKIVYPEKTNMRWTLFYGKSYTSCVLNMIFSEKYKYNISSITRVKWTCQSNQREMFGWSDLILRLSLSDKTYIISLIGLQNKICGQNTIGHLNLLIIDTRTKEVERFDPNGWATYYDNDQLDNYIRTHLPLDYTFISSSQFCPRDSIQVSQGFENMELFGDPGGFCAAWSYWWLETRLLNPDIPRDQLLTSSINQIKKNNQSLTSYIRDYSKTLIRDVYKYVIDNGYYGDAMFFKPLKDNINLIANLLPVIVEQ